MRFVVKVLLREPIEKYGRGHTSYKKQSCIIEELIIIDCLNYSNDLTLELIEDQSKYHHKGLVK